MKMPADPLMHDGSPQGQQVRWLYVDFNSFFASVEQQRNPALRGVPVAVLPLMSDTTSVIAASYEAKAYGIKTGTPVWEAKQRCPMIRLLPATHSEYVRVHKKIIEVVERDCLHVTAVCSIDEIACALGGSDRIPENALAMAERIKHVLAREIGDYIRCSIGIAPNRFLAKVMGDMKKPDGLTMLLPHDMPGPLFSLKLTDLPGISRNMSIRLSRAGVHTVADMWKLPPKHMRAIWRSVEGEKFWGMLHGYDYPARLTNRSTIGHSRVLDHPSRAPVKAYEVARQLLMKAAVRLRHENFAAGMLGMGMRLDNKSRDGEVRRFNHTQDTFLFLHALDEMWAQTLRRNPQARIKSVSVTLFDLLPPNEVTGDLFAAPPPIQRIGTTNKSLSHALDQIHAKYGSKSLSIGWRPEKLDQFGTKIAFTRVPEMDEFDI